MEIGYDEKTDTTFITGMTVMEAGVIYMSVLSVHRQLSEAGEKTVVESGKSRGFTGVEVGEAVAALKNIGEGLQIARLMQGEHYNDKMVS